MISLLMMVVSLGLRFQEKEPAQIQAGLVSFEDLKGKLEAKQPGRILDVRPRAEYDRGHIPGAVPFDIKAAEALAAKPGGLADQAAWEMLIEPLALPKQDFIVVYGDNRQLDAARAWWLLTYLGVPNVGLLDGNYSVWARSGRLTTTEKTEVSPSKRIVTFQRKRLAARDDIVALLNEPGNSRIVDARSAGEHVGTIKRSKKAGRIPESCHLEWSEFIDRDGRFLTESALRSKIAEAGIKPGQAVITHCQGGGRASVDAFVFQRLGHPTKNYYLGWSDWGNEENLPVELGAKKP